MTRKIFSPRRSCVKLFYQIIAILTKELYSGCYQILKYLHFVSLYLQLGYVNVSFWMYNKTYITKLLPCSTLNDFHYFSFHSCCIDPVSCVHSIPALLLFTLFVSGHNLFEQFHFYLLTDIKINYLHLAFDPNSVHTCLYTLCRCLAVVLGRLICFSYMFLSF